MTNYASLLNIRLSFNSSYSELARLEISLYVANNPRRCIAAGVDTAFINKIDAGKRNPSFIMVARLASGWRMKYERLVRNAEHGVLKAQNASTKMY